MKISSLEKLVNIYLIILSTSFVIIFAVFLVMDYLENVRHDKVMERTAKEYCKRMDLVSECYSEIMDEVNHRYN